MSTAAAAPPLPVRFARLVKIEHTVFALPFAYVGALLALDAVPSASQLLWITVAMVGARSLAMALNRLIDRSIDARNPRTATRELPSGALSVAQVLAFCAVSLAVFLIAVWQLDPIVRWLWPIPVAGFVIYPYLKRVTWLAHLWLGAVDGLAAVGGWVAVTGRLPWESWLLGAAVACWIAGFDLFYSLFDLDVDRGQGLHSWATRFGVEGVFRGARVLHVLTVALLVAVGLGVGVGVFYWLGVAAVAALLVYEHSLIRPGDLRRLDAAFFTVNGVISVVFLGFVLLDVIV
jgi:4-hydroxybenzoate polyprenyltransferase